MHWPRCMYDTLTPMLDANMTHSHPITHSIHRYMLRLEYLR